MSSFIAHVCPLTEIPLAAKTITSVFCQTYPLIAFVYGSQTPLPEVPCGKRELLTIYLRQLSITGLVLSVDSEDEKCVGVAVWTAPTAANQRSLYERFMSKLKLTWLNIWLFFAMVYYQGASMDAQRRGGWDNKTRELRQATLGADCTAHWYLHFLAVKPNYQGRGIAKALVRYVTDIADRDGKKCYLNTAQYEPNVAIYERLGFKVGKFAEVQVEDDSVEVVCRQTSLIIGIWNVSGTTPSKRIA